MALDERAAVDAEKTRRANDPFIVIVTRLVHLEIFIIFAVINT